MAEAWSMLKLDENRTRSLARSQTYTNPVQKWNCSRIFFFLFPPFFSRQNALFVSNCTALYFVSFAHFSSFDVQQRHLLLYFKNSRFLLDDKLYCRRLKGSDWSMDCKNRQRIQSRTFGLENSKVVFILKFLLLDLPICI